MTADIFLTLGFFPIVLAIISVYFSRKAEEEKDSLYSKFLYFGASTFFYSLTLYSCFVNAAVVQDTWDTLIGTSSNMGNPLIDLATWGLYIGLVFITLDLLFRVLFALFPQWAKKLKIKGIGWENFLK